MADAIEMTVLCQELHCLPHAGGLLDQDSYHVWLMRAVIAGQREKEERQKNMNKVSAKKPRK